MSDPTYTPPKVWTWDKASGGRFANINRPIAGPTHDKELPIGKHPMQLYSLGTPNGVKVTVMLEELLAAGHSGAEYDAWLINIGEGDQFGSGFVSVNPNSKIPALMDHSTNPPTRIFESASMLHYLAEKFGAFLPTSGAARAETMSWLMWQMGSAPYLGGGFGHFYAYAPEKYEYPINRFSMEVKRQLDVLDRQLAENEFIAGAEYTIADMAIWPWYGALVKGLVYDAAEFLSVHEYENVIRWADQLAARPAVKRGRMVNRTFGEPATQLRERHDASDFDTKTQDKLEG
ncbi:MAG: glutathione-dependent disulfide-bond oxidoreductase [Hyphomonas sp.]